ncbi:MAG: hypothetical protein JWQ79_2405 [Mucilaginibacter sp.]|nr:hypothetical protein [Mucilaginibacter sp.]
MKHTHLTLWVAMFLLLSVSVCKAQDYQPGYVILNDGTRISGWIKLNDAEPWYNQRYIRIKDSATMATDPKADPKRYRTNDMQFYQAGSRAFDKIHYINIENLQVKSFGSNDHMLERLAKGKINAHRFYQYPQDVTIYAANDTRMEEKETQKKNDLIIGYKILCQKDDDTKLHDAFDYDLLKFFEDTPEVMEKYKNGDYGNQPIVAKRGLAAKMIAMAKKAAFKPQEGDAIILAFTEYNEKNAVKK